MSERLRLIIIDVGWGDSILVESIDDATGEHRFGLIDCNDWVNWRSGLIFARRYFERTGLPAYHQRRQETKEGVPVAGRTKVFEWVLLTHGHADHARGLKRLMQDLGTKQFWYPKSAPNTSAASLINFARNSDHVTHHQAVDRTKLPNTQVSFGSVAIDILWPDFTDSQGFDTTNENNNSVVLSLTLGDQTFITTGDAEANNWASIPRSEYESAAVFQVPHHGGRNGVFANDGTTPWLDALIAPAAIVTSCHIVPHGHPHPDVADRLEATFPDRFRRTDEEFHLILETDGTVTTAAYSHQA